MSDKKFDVFGLGNAIVDLQVSVDEAAFAGFGLEKGSMNLVDAHKQLELLSRLQNKEVHRMSGGSAANTIIAAAALGADCAYTGLVADDELGRHYQQEMSNLGIQFLSVPQAGEVTATSLILVTPDAERTMNTNLGISAELGVSHLNSDELGQSEWLYVEGYLFASEPSAEIAFEAISVARRNGVRVATTFSDAFIVEVFGEKLKKAVDQSDLIFANLTEGRAYTKAETSEDVFCRAGRDIWHCLPDNERERCAGREQRVHNTD